MSCLAVHSLSLSQPRDVTNLTVGGFTPMSPRISSPMHPSAEGEMGSEFRDWSWEEPYLFNLRALGQSGVWKGLGFTEQVEELLTQLGGLTLVERDLRMSWLWAQHKRDKHNSWAPTSSHPTGQHGGFGSPGGMSRGRGRRDNELIGQTVRISQGPYKGESWRVQRWGCGEGSSIL